MNYVIQAKLKNPRRPECEQITIPFPIPIDQDSYTQSWTRSRPRPSM